MADAWDKLYGLMGRTRAAIARAREAKDEIAVAELEDYYDELESAEAELALQDLSDAALPLAALSARLENSTREIQHSIDRYFLDDIPAWVESLFGDAALAHRDDRLGPATDGHETGAPPEITPADAAAAAAGGAPPTTESEYEARFDALEVRPEWRKRIAYAVGKLVEPETTRRHRAVERLCGVPWWVVGILHMMEASLSFRAHLHNGDPLSTPTVNHPAGRPAGWRAGMKWETSAVDALTGAGRGLDGVDPWSLGAALAVFERFNGLGYRRRGLMSPYLWSGSTYFDRGKFVADGTFRPDAPSKQVGAALLLHEMKAQGLISISANDREVNPRAPAILGAGTFDKLDLTPFPNADKELDFPKPANARIAIGTKGKPVRRIQEWCYHHGQRTAIDGDFGPSTKRHLALFQRGQNLEPTGEVDRDTWLLLTKPMYDALAPAPPKESLNETVMAVARRHLAQKPLEIGNNNEGPWVRLYMQGREGLPQRWCAGFVCTLVAQACRDMGVSTPFDRQVGVDELVGDAKTSGRFIGENAFEHPALRAAKIPPGSLFVVRASNTDWTHVGFVRRLENDLFWTIEGNKDVSGVGRVATLTSRRYADKDFLLLA